jgi:hypothetical protein
MMGFTGVMLAFTIGSYILGHYKLNAKYGFYYCIALIAISLPIIAFAPTPMIAFWAVFAEGIGVGLFYLTVHTYELTETRDDERDFYSSVLSTGNRIIGLIGPLIATTIFIISENMFHIPGYILLFIISPCVVMMGVLCFDGIQDYIPRKVEFADVTHFFSEKRNLLAQLYIGGSGMKDMIETVIPPLVIYAILGTEIKVGIYNTILAIFGTVVVILVGHKRNAGNRMKVFGYSSAVVSLALIYLGVNFDLTSLIIFSIINSTINPLMSSASHVIALQTMESIGREGKDFYSTMILRDFSLWFWRIITGGALLLLLANSNGQQNALSTGLFTMAFLIMLAFFGAKIFFDEFKRVQNKA